MSRDNTVLILGLRVKTRRIWVVVHVQAHEMFGDPQWTRWWLYSHPVQYTMKRRLAENIAKKMASAIQHLEHGILRFYSAAPIDDCILKNGEVEFPSSVEYPEKWVNECDEDHWEIIHRDI